MLPVEFVKYSHRLFPDRTNQVGNLLADGRDFRGIAITSPTGIAHRYQDMLEKIPLFSGLTGEELSLLEQHASKRSYPRHAVIINEGDETDSLYVILSGKVRVFMSDQDGKEIILNEQGPGEHFGELALVDDAPRSASVMTLQKTQVSVITRNDFRDVLARNSDIAFRLIQSLSRRIRVLSDNVRNLALLDVYGRVAKLLLGMAEEIEGRLTILERPTQQELANHIGASREMVARILKDLETGGYITITRKQIVINEKLPNRY
jgi:CRP/FNR family cyclic AMP-dependent transcriptional regulator